MCEDAVLVDATLERENVGTYQIVTEQPNAFWHVLVVSRTYLPINFQGLRPGGAPKYPYPLPRMGAMEPGPAWTNREIAEWAARQLLAIRDEAPRPRLPRTDSRKLGDPAAWKEIGTLQMELIEQSLDAARRAQEPCSRSSSATARATSSRSSDWRPI
ncbi:MAG: hypothetical protein QOJ16_408 [Acidobacteriota bacterium]|jgi:hypothetical protein|nr:hypothetical protein [Acidobacteriota bacterium]